MKSTKQTSGRRAGVSLRAGVVGITLIPAVLAILVMGVTFSALSYRVQHRYAVQQQQRMALLTAGWVASSFEGMVNDLTQVVQARRLTAQSSRNEQAQILRQLLVRVPCFHQVALIDAGGTVVARGVRTSNAPDSDNGFPSAESLNAVSTDATPYISNLRWSAHLNSYSFELVVPLHADHGPDTFSGLVGVLAAELELCAIMVTLEGVDLTPGEFIYLIDAGAAAVLSTEGVLPVPGQIPEPHFAGVTHGSRGKQVVAASSAGTVWNWGFLVVAELNATDAFGLYRTLSIFTILALLLIAGLTILWSLAASRRIGHPILRLAEAAETTRTQARTTTPPLYGGVTLTNPLLDLKRSGIREADSLACSISAMVQQLNQNYEQLRASLRERDVFIAEIHHRVRNNLQLIVSLNQLQCSTRAQQDPVRHHRTFQRRVQAMALVHEHMGATTQDGMLMLNAYLESLVEQLAHEFPLHGGVPVARTVEGCRLLVTLDQSVPLGLILAELLSNVYRFSFPSTFMEDNGTRFYPEPQLRVVLEAEAGTTTAVLHIEHNGLPWTPPQPGLSADQHNGAGIGLLLVESLLPQIQASIAWVLPPEGGSRCSLRFPLLSVAAETGLAVNESSAYTDTSKQTTENA